MMATTTTRGGGLAQLRGTYEGARCAILGNGPSLPRDVRTMEQADVGCPLSIGVNRSWKCRVSLLHVALDRVHVDELGEGLWSTGVLFTRPQVVDEMRWSLLGKCGVVSLDGPPEDYPLGRHVPLAGPAAIQVALWLGFKLILLCGFDMHDGDGRKFYDYNAEDMDGRDVTGVVGASTSFVRQRRYVERLMRWAERHGVEMMCVDGGSALVEEGIVSVWKGRRG